MVNYVAGAGHRAQVPSSNEHEVVWRQSGVKQWLSTLPVICFSYQGHISAVPLYCELRCRSMKRWGIVISVGLFACVALYNATGVLGYLEFLEKTQSDILKSFTDEHYEPNIPLGLVSVARIAVAIAVSVTSAVFTFCARSAILDELLNMQGRPHDRPTYATFLLVTYVWLALVAMVAICVPDIGDVVSIVGNVCAFFMFHFPGMCMIVTAWNDATCSECESSGTRVRQWSQLTRRQRFKVVVGWLFIVLGSVIFCCGMFSALTSL
jgi:amino acid permease